MIMKTLPALGAVALSAAITACSSAGTDTAAEPVAGPTEIILSVERIVPESIDSTEAGSIFVGDVIGNRVYRVPAGTTDTEEFIPGGSNGLERVLGVYADEAHQLLWVCSTGSMPPAVASFDLDTGTPVGRYNLPEENPTACNDIAVSSTGNVYIGETTGGGVAWMPSGGDHLEYLVKDVLLSSADGVALLDDRTLIVNGVQTGKLVRVDLSEDGSFRGMMDLTLSRELEGPDGMRTIGPNRLILAENRAGRMTVASIDGDNVELETLKEGLEGTPAVTATRGLGWIIEGQFNLMQDAEAEPRPFVLYGVPLE
jgi:sugar lactone lactonase YvrE